MNEIPDNINDKEIIKLLKLRMLSKDDEALLKAEEKMAYSLTPTVIPSADMEKALTKKAILKKGIASVIKKYIWKLFLPGASAIVVSGAAVYYYQQSINPSKQQKEGTKPAHQQVIMSDSALLELKTNATNQASKAAQLNVEQLLDSMLIEHADFTNAIYVRDSIIVSKHRSNGTGNAMDIEDNANNDSKYVEKQHNIVWYKFIARQDSKLTFDILPENEQDDYDFMLFQYNGLDFKSQLTSRQIKPIRACISGSDKHLKGATGLTADPAAPAFIHSGIGKSYVKSVAVLKGQVYYLLVNAVQVHVKKGRQKGAGHTICFHFRKFGEDELYVGKRLYFNRLEFNAGASVFRSGSGYMDALDTIAGFLKRNPRVKIEIQGHVNTFEPQMEHGRKTETQILSEDRAAAVFDCLVERGIDSFRMARVGYGGTKRIIPVPQKEEEYRRNVRVEVVIKAVE
ncbi:MAG TPA: OmpA family protein [Bacteroidia bacterium]|jgi:flagellar motor protein MotB|nr:OmpA family protein [Bacteroidia bacterium]